MTEPTIITVIIIASIALGVAIGYPWGFSRGSRTQLQKVNNILNKYKNRI